MQLTREQGEKDTASGGLSSRSSAEGVQHAPRGAQLPAGYCTAAHDACCSLSEVDAFFDRNLDRESIQAWVSFLGSLNPTYYNFEGIWPVCLFERVLGGKSCRRVLLYRK